MLTNGAVRGAIVGCLFVACLGSAEGAEEPQAVSMIQLLATPERYEGRRVLVHGVAHFEFEESGLYLHREDAECMNSSNGLWLAVSGQETLSDVFVVVDGVFTAKRHGHLGAWPGELTNITLIHRAGTRRDYAKVPPPPARR